MRVGLFVLVLLMSINRIFAQQMDFQLFNKSGAKMRQEVNRNKEVYRQIKSEHKALLKERKKAFKDLKDSLNATGDKGSWKEQFKEPLGAVDIPYADSLKGYQQQAKEIKQLSKDSLKELQGLQKSYYLYTDSLYQLEDIATWDSLKRGQKARTMEYAEDRLSGNYYYDRYAGYKGKLLGYRKELKGFRDSLKSTTLDESEKSYLVEKKKAALAKQYRSNIEKTVEEELVKREIMPFPTSSTELEEFQKIKGQMGGLMNGDLPSDVNTHGLENIEPGEAIDVAKTQGMSFLEGKEELLETEMNNMQDLKKKYSSVPNSSDLSTATKRKSLKGTRFLDRLIFGGNFQIYIDKDWAVDLSPELSYLFNKSFSLGIGATYQVNGDLMDLLEGKNYQAVYGLRSFVEHKLFGSFYAHIEYELMSRPVLDSSEWQKSFLAGFEKRIAVSAKFEGQIAVLYNFMHKDIPGANPINVRVGFNLINNKK